MPKYYYEVDKFIEWNSNTELKSKYKQLDNLPIYTYRYTRIEYDYAVSYYYDIIENQILYTTQIQKNEYWNNSQIKKQLLLKALKELK
jgi:hypothetical protein